MLVGKEQPAKPEFSPHASNASAERTRKCLMLARCELNSTEYYAYIITFKHFRGMLIILKQYTLEDDRNRIFISASKNLALTGCTS